MKRNIGAALLKDMEIDRCVIMTGFIRGYQSFINSPKFFKIFLKQGWELLN